MSTVFDFANVSSSLGVSGGSGDVGGASGELAAFFENVVSANDASMLMLCARLGALDTDAQNKVRSQVEARDDVKAKLEEAEKLVAEKCALGFFGGDKPSVEDAKLLSAMYSLFALLLKPEGRSSFPALLAWFERCGQQMNDTLMGANHMAGVKREGGQVDCYADSKYVRSHADFTNALNASTKKKKSQRQLEKEAKALKVPEASETFQFTKTVSKDAPIDEKIAAVREALTQIGASADGEMIRHDPVQTMADFPAEVKSRKGFLCKNLLLEAKVKKDGETESLFWLVTAPEQAKIDLKVLAKGLGHKARLAKPESLLAAIGVEPGQVTPFALLNDPTGKVTLILDQKMMSDATNQLWLHPLTNSATMSVSAGDLFSFVAATARQPVLMSFEHEEAAATSNAASAQPAAGTGTSAPTEPLKLSPAEANQRLLDRLAKAGVVPFQDPNPDLTAKRPVGHSTHNLFVKDKKTKQLYMISMRQHINANLKVVAKAVGAKELRFADSSFAAFCHEKGCVSLLNLYNNVQGDVIPVIDSELFKAETLRICVGCNDPVDHSQHNLVDVSPALIQELLAESNTPTPKEVEFEE
mmetsp:Transcript_21844/g.38624  ORF Transcript_21844/g.38624 Transcript_21844/m.38624 type:complete len:586 (-) Transcript_21844:99-1856(-)